MSQQQNTAVVVRTAADLVKVRMNAMLKSLGGGQDAAERFRQAAIGCALSNSLSGCTPESVYKCVYQCARLSLVPDPVLHLAAIVPFKNHGIKEATLIIEYRGLLTLARRADPSMHIKVGSVYEGDDYILEEGLEDVFKITKRWWEKGLDDPGKLMFSYCSSKQTGSDQTLLMVISRQEALAIGKASKAGMREGTPWCEHFERMAEKTAIRRSSRLWTLDPTREATRRLQEALDWDERSEELPDTVTDDVHGTLPPEPPPALEGGEHYASGTKKKKRTKKKSSKTATKPETEPPPPVEAEGEVAQSKDEAVFGKPPAAGPAGDEAMTPDDKSRLRMSLDLLLDKAGISTSSEARRKLFDKAFPPNGAMPCDVKHGTHDECVEWISEIKQLSVNFVQKAVNGDA